MGTASLHLIYSITMLLRKDGRRTDEMRPVSFIPDFHRKNCVLACFGETKVICYASIEDRVPAWLVGAEHGWPVTH